MSQNQGRRRPGWAWVALALAGRRWTLRVPVVLGVMMMLNAVHHTAVTLWTGPAMPGMHSSPLLFAVSLWLVLEARRRRRQGLDFSRNERSK